MKMKNIHELFEDGKIGLSTYYLRPSNAIKNIYLNERELEILDREYLARIHKEQNA